MKYNLSALCMLWLCKLKVYRWGLLYIIATDTHLNHPL